MKYLYFVFCFLVYANLYMVTATGAIYKDAFDVPKGFKPSYILVNDSNIDLGPNGTRRNVKIRIPMGLSFDAVKFNTLAAAESAYNRDRSPNAITVFAYKPNTDTRMKYTAGRLIWAPGGDWLRADEKVSISNHIGVFDLSDLYSDAPGRASTEISNIMADQAAEGREEERPLLRRYSQRRLKRMFYAIEQGINDEVSAPDMPGNVEGSLAARKLWICKKYGITASQYETIRELGEDQNWPGPDMDTR